MPNYITNRLEIIADSEKVEKVKDFLRNPNEEHTYIDFNNIVKMPKELKIDSTGWLMPLENPFSVNEPFKKTVDGLKKYLSNAPKDVAEETIKAFLQGIENYIRLDHATWFNWSKENWGSKWNASNQSIEDNVIHFETAWNGVPELIEKLSIVFPEVEFDYKWADEDTGSNVGSCIFNGREKVVRIPENGSKEAYELAFELNPENEKHYKLVGDTYEWDEDLEEDF